MQGRFGELGTPTAHLSADGQVVLQVEGLLLFAFQDRHQEQLTLLTQAGWCVMQNLADVGEALETALGPGEVGLRPLGKQRNG